MKAVLHWGLAAVALGYMAYTAPGLIGSAGAEAGHWGEVHWSWLPTALLLALAAITTYAELHRRLLAVGGAHLPSGTVLSVTFVENAIALTVPVVGGAGGLAYAISRFRRHGVDSTLASWAVLLAGSLAALILIGMAPIALALAGRLSALVAGLIIVAVAMAGFAAWTVATRRTVLHAVLRPILWAARFLPGQCETCRQRRAADAEVLIEHLAGRLSLLRPTSSQWFVLVPLAAATWALDFADLGATSAAVLGTPPWSALVVGYLLVQASIALQLLPGGAGLAEVGLLGALVGSGLAAGPAAAVVLIYRVNSWLLPAVIGWVAYGVQVHAIRPGEHRHQPTPALR